MWMKSMTVTALMTSLTVGPMIGCESLPGDKKSQGAVIGGIGGALAGAAVAGSDDRGIGALIGAVAGAGGGYLIGAKVDEKDKDDAKKKQEALQASKNAEANPASADAAKNATTADVNDDGFVTLDEVIAMERANLSDREMIERLDRTGQVFELTEEQERYLEDRGVSHEVIVEMRRMSPDDTGYARTASAGRGDDVEDYSRREAEQARSREEKPRDFEPYRNGDRFDRF